MGGMPMGKPSTKPRKAGAGRNLHQQKKKVKGKIMGRRGGGAKEKLVGQRKFRALPVGNGNVAGTKKKQLGWGAERN